MKKITLYTLSLAFIAVGMASCGKTTKGKMINEWKVTSMEQVETLVNVDGDKSISTLSFSGNAAAERTDYQPKTGPSSTNTETGIVNTNDFTIKKDGTWSWIMDVTYTNGNSSNNQRVERSGTWSFLDKTKGDDFKKHERVLFNVLTMKAVYVLTSNQQVVINNTDNLTYSTGQNTLIYTVKESKKDKLELELESKNVFTQNNSDTNSDALTQKITLEEK